MNESSDEYEKKLQELKSKKSQLEIELSKIIKSKANDDKTVMQIYDMSVELDDIEDEIARLEKARIKTADDDGR